jgi:hypothetical protein
MKITTTILKKIIREEITKIVSTKDPLILEMFATGGAGDEVGGMSAEEKKRKCPPGKWVEDKDEFGKSYGYCSEPIKEADEFNETLENDIKDKIQQLVNREHELMLTMPATENKAAFARWAREKNDIRIQLDELSETLYDVMETNQRD